MSIHIPAQTRRHRELLLPSNKVRQETENKYTRDGLFLEYITNVILPRTFMTGGREAMQKLKVTSLVEAKEKCLNIHPLAIKSH